VPSDYPLLYLVERFLTETNMPPTRFGREAISDPRLVFDLRLGREAGSSVRCRVEHFMNKSRAERAANRGEAA
jgi:hypothetical protein